MTAVLQAVGPTLSTPVPLFGNFTGLGSATSSRSRPGAFSASLKNG
jgi:hypothetical protein